MKTERWVQRFTGHGLPRLALQTLLIYWAIAVMAQIVILSIDTPQTYRSLQLVYVCMMLLVTTVLVVWLVARYVGQVQQSDARYRQLVEQATDGIFVCDLAGNLEDVNAASCAMLGYAREELLQRTVADVIDPDDLAASPLHMERLSHGQSVTTTRRLLSRTGRPIIVEINARQFEAGRIMGIVRDVTTRHEMEAALRASEAQLRALIDALSDVIIVLDAQGTYLQVAPTSPSALIAPADQLLGRTLAQVLPPDKAATYLEVIQRALQTHSTISLEYELVIDHKPRWFAANVSPVSDDRVVWVARDVTSLKHREREWAAMASLAAELRVAASSAEVMPLIVRQVEQWLDIETAALGVINSYTEEIVLKAAHGIWQPYLGLALPLAEGVAAAILHTGSLYASNSLSDDPHIARPELLQGVRALLVVPLVADGGPLGMLAVGRTAPFTEEDSRLLSMLANIAAGALQRAAVHDQAQRRAEQLATLNTIGRTLAELLDLSQIFKQLAAAVQQIFPDMLALLISRFDAVRQIMTCIYGWERGQLLDISRLPPAPLEPLGYGAQSESIHLRQPVIVQDLPARLKHARTSVILGELALSAIYVPLLAKGEVIGVVQVQSSAYNRFTAEDAEVLSLLAGTAAISIQNARLFEQTQQRVRELALLYDSSRAITSTLDKSSVLHSAAERIALAVDATSAYLVWCDWTHNIARVITAYFSPQATVQERLSDLNEAYRLSDYPRALEALRAQRHSITQMSQSDADPAALESLPPHGGKRSLRVPLTAVSQTLGYVVLWDSCVERAWTDSEIRVCQTLANQAAVALENVELYETIQRQTAEQAALLEASRAISSTLDLPTMLQRLAEQMGRAIDVTSAYICEWNPRTGLSTVLADYYSLHASAEERVSDLGKSYQPERDMGLSPKWVASPEATITHIDDPDQPELRRQHIRLYGGQSVLTIPLVAKDVTVGFAELWESRHHREFTADEISLCHSMAQQAAMAFENARLFEAERQQLRLAHTLQAVGALLTAGMNLDEVFNYIFDLLAHVVHYDSVSIQLLSEGQILFAAGRGFTNMRRAHEIVRESLPPSLEERWAEPHRRVMVISDTEHDPRWYAMPGSEPIRSWVGAALRVKGRLLGIINVDSFTPNTYDEATGETVAAFANQAAIAIENAQLHDAVRRHAEELEGRVADRTLELERERKRTAAILDAAGEGIIFTNLKGSIEYMNAAMERLTGFTAEETLGQNPRVWQSGTTPVSVYQKMWQTINRGEIWRGELVNRRKEGTLYDAALTIAPVFDIDGQISGYVGVQSDISHQKELDRLKDEFVSNVSHELRTPIANVKLYISLLTRGKPEKYNEYLQTLRREAARLEKLIEDLLELSRLDLGRQPVSLTPTDVNQLAAQLIGDRTALAAGRQLLIDYRAESPLPFAQADPTMLSQVVSNLLTNAINYTAQGGVIAVATAARARDEQTWITITIQDTGPGISQHDRAHIFERFYRGEAGRKSGAPGTGLGLAISTQIMNKLGGSITEDSQPGEGAAFTVWLKPA